MKPTVRLVIVNWNSGELLRHCLQHCLRQTVLADEIMVVDNDSHDDSLRGVAELPGVTVMRMTANLGFAAGNNQAIARCETDFVALLNPDAFPEPHWLESLLSASALRPDMVAFGSRQMRAEAEGTLDGIGDRYFISGQVRRDGYLEPCSPADLVGREIFSPCAAAALYRRDALEACGGFDEDFFCYAEDVDLGFRLRLLGYGSWYVPDAVVRHLGSGTTGGQHSDFATYHGHRNLVWVFVKNMPGWLFWSLLPLHAMLNLASVFWLALQGRGRVAVRAKRDAIMGLPAMWRKRREIAGARRATIAQIWRQLDKRLLAPRPGHRR